MHCASEISGTTIFWPTLVTLSCMTVAPANSQCLHWSMITTSIYMVSTKHIVIGADISLGRRTRVGSSSLAGNYVHHLLHVNLLHQQVTGNCARFKVFLTDLALELASAPKKPEPTLSPKNILIVYVAGKRKSQQSQCLHCKQVGTKSLTSVYCFVCDAALHKKCFDIWHSK